MCIRDRVKDGGIEFEHVTFKYKHGSGQPVLNDITFSTVSYTHLVLPLAKELGLDKKGGCILSYNGGKIIDCRTGETLYQKQLDAHLSSGCSVTTPSLL